jgi:hypothetical protein
MDEQPVKSKKSHYILTFVIGISVIGVIILILGIATNWFRSSPNGPNGPAGGSPGGYNCKYTPTPAHPDGAYICTPETGGPYAAGCYESGPASSVGTGCEGTHPETPAPGPCPKGKWSTNGIEPCKPCSTCPAGQAIDNPCTSTADATCKDPPAFTQGIPFTYDSSYWSNFTDSKDRLKAGDNFFMRGVFGPDSKTYYYKHVSGQLTNSNGKDKDTGYIFRFEWKADSVPGTNSKKPGYQGLIYGVNTKNAIKCGSTLGPITCSMDIGGEADYEKNESRSWYSMIITDSDFNSGVNTKNAAIEITNWSYPQVPHTISYVCMAGSAQTWGCTNPTSQIEASRIQICFVDNPYSTTPEFAVECNTCIEKPSTSPDFPAGSSYWCRNDNQCYLHGATKNATGGALGCPTAHNCVAANKKNCDYGACTY